MLLGFAGYPVCTLESEFVDRTAPDAASLNFVFFVFFVVLHLQESASVVFSENQWFNGVF